MALRRRQPIFRTVTQSSLATASGHKASEGGEHLLQVLALLRIQEKKDEEEDEGNVTILKATVT
jgi:hypothetical protein